MIEYKLDNVQLDIPDDRDFIFSTNVLEEELPLVVDNRKYAGEIENQGHTSSCVANATISALEFLHKESGLDINLSRLFEYYNLREPYIKLKDKDHGAYVRDGFKMVNKFGVCLAKLWPFDENKVNTKPDERSYNDAVTRKVQKYERIQTKDNMIYNMKSAIAQGFPIIIGVMLGRTFFHVSGPLEKQQYKGVQNDLIGSHCMNVVGYNDELKGFIVENSWSTAWGDNGFCLLAYDVMKKDCLDAWTCTEFMNLDIHSHINPKTIEPEPTGILQVLINIIKSFLGFFH